jgi:hypothetical protein
MEPMYLANMCRQLNVDHLPGVGIPTCRCAQVPPLRPGSV